MQSNSDFLDVLDEYVPEDIVLCGYITDFDLVPEDRRSEFLKDHAELVHEAFFKPIGRAMALYPHAPCRWLVQNEQLEREGHLDPHVELAKLRASVVRLWPAKDLYVGDIRMLPFIRPLKRGRVHLLRDLPHLDETIDMFTRYPDHCTDAEKYRVQQFARVTMNVMVLTTPVYAAHTWPRYFWQHNLALAACVPRYINVTDRSFLDETQVSALYGILERNARTVVAYLDSVAMQYPYDLYVPERDEILLGLFSRVTRLYVLVASQPSLWSRDIAGIMLRCLVDTAITFAYLAKRGTEQIFANFKAYGEGKEKLLMLHLQDTYRDKRSLDGHAAEDIAQELGGGFTPEMIDIELDNWTKKSVRDLAFDAEMEDFYRLVYDPASADVHGTWISLTKSNLVRCGEPLHKFHRIPSYYEPPLFVRTVAAVQDVYLRCLHIGIQSLKFPVPSTPIEPIDDFSAASG